MTFSLGTNCVSENFDISGQTIVYKRGESMFSKRIYIIHRVENVSPDDTCGKCSERMLSVRHSLAPGSLLSTSLLFKLHHGVTERLS